MISANEYYKNPEFCYDKVAERIDEYVNEGIEKVGGAEIAFDCDLKSDEVRGGEFGCGRFKEGHCEVNPHYYNELIFQLHKSGLHYEEIRGGDYHRVTRILISL